MNKRIAVTVGGLLLVGGAALTACGGATPVPGPAPTPTHIKVCCAPATPTAPPVIGANQSATFNGEIIDQMGGPSGHINVTWNVGAIKRAPSVMLTNQGLDPNPAITTTDPTVPVPVYPVGGSAAGGADDGNGSWYANPQFQFVSVYVNIVANHFVGKPLTAVFGGKELPYSMADVNLWWVTSGGQASEVNQVTDDATPQVANALGIHSSTDLLGQGTVFPGGSLGGTFSESVPAGPGQLQVRDSNGITLLVITVP